MDRLLGDEFVPLTFTIGFLESDLDSVTNVFKTLPGNDVKKITNVSGSIQELLAGTAPLSRFAPTELLVTTNSPWTAIFESRIRGADLCSPLYIATRKLRCRGLSVTSIPNTITSDREKKGVYGATKFTLLGENGENVRHIHALNDGPWTFFMEGEPLPFEQLDRYSLKKKRERLTPAMLDEYTRALGVPAFDVDFYGREGRIIERSFSGRNPNPRMSLRRAQQELGFVPPDDTADDISAGRPGILSRIRALLVKEF